MSYNKRTGGRTRGSRSTRGGRIGSVRGSSKRRIGRGGKNTGTSTRRGKRGTRVKKSTRGKRKQPAKRKRITEERFDKHKFSNPFGSNSRKQKYKTSFGQFYESGEIPCRISHGGSMTKIHLKWRKNVNELPYDPYFLYFCEGLRETNHPYVVLAAQGFREFCEAEGSGEKIIPLLPKAIMSIRKALTSSSDVVFKNGLSAVEYLSNCVGEGLSEKYLNTILVQIAKKAFNKKYSVKINELLNVVEENSGRSVTSLIKMKVPTYTSVFV